MVLKFSFVAVDRVKSHTLAKLFLSTMCSMDRWMSSLRNSSATSSKVCVALSRTKLSAPKPDQLLSLEFIIQKDATV